ncbi:TonB-dependent receptor domain-containing protein [Lysobacter yangpyeongensis]|uniref:TonB-dependent receptor domain-containing protein n=1 Tax=Lysobacter yangpyeongensis TaxID=346182 RepID=A0ABW0SHK3_9GAMM
MAPSRHLPALLWGALSLCLASPVQAAGEVAPARTALVVPAGDLDTALKALATQGRVQILYPPELVAGRRARGLQARLGIPEALARLLRGTGLRAVAVNANTFLLQRIPEPAKVADAPRRRSTPSEMATVQVTGSRIPRSDLDIVTPSPLTIITRDEIETSGHQTLFELLRVQPGMVGHHPVDVASEGSQDGGQQPFAAAATTSLDGLGPRATLFLVDGRRVANYGLISVDLGGLTDLDSIPLSIVDRIEIIRGGASAIYGADAMAGVVNIILRKQGDRGEVAARYGVSEHGDAQERRLSFSDGFDIAGGGNVFIGLDYLQRDELTGRQRKWRTLDYRRHGLGDWRIPLGYRDLDYNLVQSFCMPGVKDIDARCLFDPVRWSTLQPRSERSSFYGHLQQPLGDEVQLGIGLRASNATQDMLNPPFHALVDVPEDHPDAIPGTELGYAFFDIGPIRSHNRERTLDVAVTLDGSLGAWDWNLAVSHDANTVRNQTDGLVRETVFTDAVFAGQYRFGTPDNPPALLAAISPRVVAKGEAALDQFSAGLNGAWFALPAGDAQLALGVEFNRDALRHRPDPLMLENDVALGPQKILIDAHRYSSAVYAELSLPLASRLQADIAARWDHRQGYGSKVSPKIGFKWRALDALTFRGTAATGYRAPSLFEQRRPSVFDYYDVIVWNPELGPCRYSARLAAGDAYCLVLRGAMENPDLDPETSRSHTLGLVWAPDADLSLSLDHFRIERRNEILPGNAIDDPSAFPLSIVRDEDGLLIGINDYFANVGRTDVRGWDWDARYRLQTARAGRWTFDLAGQYLTHVLRQARPGAPPLDYAGHGTADRSASAIVQWAYAAWSTALTANHRGEVRVSRPGEACPSYNADAGRCRTPAMTTLDFNIAYAGLPDWQIAFNVRNLRDRDPVNYDVDKGGYDIASDDPRGRYYLLSVARRF